MPEIDEEIDRHLHLIGMMQRDHTEQMAEMYRRLDQLLTEQALKRGQPQENAHASD